MQTAMSDPQWQMNWTRKLSQMDHDSLLANAKSEAWKEGYREGWEEGFKEGFKEGFEEGVYRTLANLVRKKLLSVAEAAAEVGISESDFEKKLV